MRFKGFLPKAFGWLGVLMAIAAVIGAFGSNDREAAMIQVVAFGVASLACFRASEFLEK